MPSYILICLLILPTVAFTQNKSKYEEIYNSIDQLPKSRQLIVGDSLLKHAKTDHDKVYALFYRAHTEMYADDYSKSYHYLVKADSLIDLNGFKKEKVNSLNMLNGIYKNLKMYSNFYDNIQVLNKIVEDAPKDDPYYTRVKAGNLLSLANYYSFIKDQNKALQSFKDCIQFLEKHHLNNITLVKALNDLAILYAEMDDLELSIITFNKMNAINTKYVNNKHFMMLYYLNVGVNYKLKKEFENSREFLEKGLELANEYNIEFYKSSLKDQLAIIYDSIGENEKAKVLESEQLKVAKEVFKNKLLTNEQVTSNLNKINKKQIEKSQKSYQSLIIIAVIVFIVMLIIVFIESRKRKIIKQKFDQIILDYENRVENKIEVDEVFFEEEKKSIELMSKAKENEILEALNEFEKSEKFLQQDMSISSLAAALNTNIKYVSYILKKYRNCNYNQYINQMRIDYLINLLIVNPTYRKYKLDHLANIIGFSNNSRLTTIFKQYKGISPSVFIKNLSN